ncbi:MAG: peptide chain release factor N(5)-glutamine methyltransferase [Ignavibacteria bacterium]|nr:peptide chain release factor N(5)-glutamine methyltransferase [Ignavibacteria bacterium]
MHRRGKTADERKKPATIGSAIDEASARFLKAGVEDPRLNAELLLASLLQIGRMDLRMHRTEQLQAWSEEQFLSWVRRREAREPLQYITGWTEFMGLRFHVDRSVLIPRPETELLVELAVALLRGSPNPAPTVLDVGTGSGNIALSIARFVPHAEVTAIDVSSDALDVAEGNARDLGIPSVAFRHADIVTFEADSRFDMLASNPPYVPLGEFTDLAPEISRFEPQVATTDGEDGLRYVRLLARRAGELLKPEGALLIELGFGQAEEARRIAENCGLSGVCIQEDLSGVPRVLSAVYPGNR